MVYRSRMEIQAAILHAAASGSAKTRIMYRAGLASAQLTSYLNDLVSMGFVEYNATSKVYRTAKKGNEFLQSYRQLTVFIE